MLVMISGKTLSLFPKMKRKTPTLSEKFVILLFLLSPSTDLVPKSKSAPKARPKKEDKVYLEIDARFERPDRRGRGRGDGRGDRGGDRGDRSRNFRGGGGGGGRGPPRSGAGGRQNGANTVDDQAAFPSLT